MIFVIKLFAINCQKRQVLIDVDKPQHDSGVHDLIAYKPTDSHYYLLHLSSRPQQVKNSIPFPQFFRLRRLCSDNSDFNSKCKEMSQFFKNVAALTLLSPQAGIVPKKSIKKPHYKRHKAKKPTEFHSPSPTVPQNLAVKNVILKNFKFSAMIPKLNIYFFDLLLFHSNATKKWVIL